MLNAFSSAKAIERSEDAGAQHFLAAGIERSEQLADAAEVIDNDLRQQKIYKRACQKRQKQSRRIMRHVHGLSLLNARIYAASRNTGAQIQKP